MSFMAFSHAAGNRIEHFVDALRLHSTTAALQFVRDRSGIHGRTDLIHHCAGQDRGIIRCAAAGAWPGPDLVPWARTGAAMLYVHVQDLGALEDVQIVLDVLLFDDESGARERLVALHRQHSEAERELLDHVLQDRARREAVALLGRFSRAQHSRDP